MLRAFWECSGLRDLAGLRSPPRVRVAFRGMRRELPRLPPLAACGIPAEWSALPLQAQFLERDASWSSFYQLIWEDAIAPGVSALCERAGGRVSWMGFCIDVGVQKTMFALVEFPDDENSEDEELTLL